jgi:GT2 family glycosyltransferase
MEILISVVIATYKRPSLLYRCLSALGRQNFPSEYFEVIVVSDGPDPHTAWLLESDIPIAHNFCHCALDKRQGPATARNAGWLLARGELIVFTDDDCLPAKDWLLTYYSAWQGYRELRPKTLSWGACVAFRGSVTVPRPDRPTDYEKNTAGLETAGFVTANCAVTKRALLRVKGFDESFTMAWREDSDLEFRLLEHNIPILFIPQARVLHPVRPAPWGVSLKEQKKSRFNALLYKKHPFLFRRRIYRHPFFNYYVIVSVAVLALVFLLAGQWGGALAGGLVWLLLTLNFARQRLTGTSRSPNHILEMIVTSMIIPFLSIFWTLYGSIRYKTFFL